ncbi:hypothetical protein [Bradyrhizobium sp. th.b2]|uniref:DUF4376 domain-containing protein n=1 Tax=Bradyrhizobium sp. th-b2 TaxID=172088 RepID=UPI000407EAC8|nr:hypothetical protein [Bradyrhizobium sp. th.b2]
MLYVKDNGQDGFLEIPYGASFTGSDEAIHPYQCIELWDETDLNAIGVFRVEPAALPTDPEVSISGYHFEKGSDGVIKQVLDLIQPPPPTKDDLKAYAASKRYAKEVGGTVSPTYGFLYTDRDTRALIAQSIQSIDLQIVTEPINWKSPAGFVSLDRAALVAISREMATFVQTTFDKEAEIDSKIADGTIAAKAEIDAAFA